MGIYEFGTTVSDWVQEASYNVLYLIPETKIHPAIAESLIVPGCTETVSSMSGTSEAQDIGKGTALE